MFWIKTINYIIQIFKLFPFLDKNSIISKNRWIFFSKLMIFKNLPWRFVGPKMPVRSFLLLLSLSYSFTEVIPTDKVEVGFKDLDAAILVGSMPRKEGMERKDLLKANVAIFKTQGEALEKYARKTVKVQDCNN